MNQKYMIYMYLLKARTFIALLLVIAFFSVMVPNFLTTSNLLIMTQHVAITGLLAIGMTLVILTGGIDLSVGAVAGICGMVAGALLTNGLPIWGGNIIFFNVPEVIICVALFGVVVGFVNGAVITRFGVAPFICTLGMMYVAGSALLFNDGSTYPNLNGMDALGNTGFATLGSGTLLGIYLPIWLMIAFLLLGYWVTTKTPLGRYIYAIGGNESAARLAGVPIVKAKILCTPFPACVPLFVGLIVASQLQTAHPMTGNMFGDGCHWRNCAGRNCARGRTRTRLRLHYRCLRNCLPRRWHGDDGRQRLLADGYQRCGYRHRRCCRSVPAKAAEQSHSYASP